jgi:predicted DNA-binding transcriptional regulator AlpA
VDSTSKNSTSSGQSGSANRIRLIRFSQLRAIVPLSRTTIWRRVHDGTFPRPIRLSGNVLAWRVDQVEAWISDREKC